MTHFVEKINSMSSFDALGRYVLADYDHTCPFSSFLPGVAGLKGIPMWMFYVNRGQVVSSFGVEDKDHPILEFQAANKAYQIAGLTGFRTFLNGFREGEAWQREAFAPWEAEDAQRTMFIGMNEVEIQEINPQLGYQVNVLYYMLPNMPFSGLVRRVSLRNLLDAPLNLEILDGLPGVVPYGVDDDALKSVGRTIEAWMQAENLENKLPFYRLKATPGDSAAVEAIRAGNFGLAFLGDALLPAIADPPAIFGLDTSHSRAHHFHKHGLQAVLASPQITEGRSLCAFFGAEVTLNPGASETITSLYGYSPTLSSLQSRVEFLKAPGFWEQKLQIARYITEDLTEDIHTESASTTFDGYCQQTFLDNVLRGGYPLVLGGKHIIHVYGRKHGDIERDYNQFVIPPEYYAQGNANFRDVNQNRRNDVFFVPGAGEFNIRVFMSLIQPDGYNPLVLNGLTFSIPEEKRPALLAYAEAPERLAALLEGTFTPGALLDAIISAGATIPVDDLFARAFSVAEMHLMASFEEGYWVDHWTYTQDLIESYLTVFPEKKAYLLFDSPPLPFYDSAAIVQPRSARYVLYRGKPHQLNAVHKDREKEELIKSRGADGHWVCTEHGQGEVFRLPLISKLALLSLLKYAALDPSGMGIQMEAGKPGWNDALNGLPGLFGSSMPETFELLRLVQFMIDALDEFSRDIPLPIEAGVLLEAIGRGSDQPSDLFADWVARTDALEDYRAGTRLGFDGRTQSVDFSAALRKMQAGLQAGVAAAHTFTGTIPPTYFIHEVTNYELTGTHAADGNPHVRVKGFRPSALPIFLEGPVREMKIADARGARELAQAVRESALFDRKLGMFKINVSLDDQPYEIGRLRAFTPGWLENESIWMHMSYKYLLALINAGLYDEFYDVLKTHLPAFMDPQVYGRSPLESCSFIVSSAHPDASLHGAGFVARMSGLTAEFISMWRLMTMGKQPFQLIEGELALVFAPALPGWLFKSDGTFRFRCLGTCTVTVHNPDRRDTWDEGLKIQRIDLHSGDETIRIDGGLIQAPYAEGVRQGEFDAIDLFF